MTEEQANKMIEILDGIRDNTDSLYTGHSGDVIDELSKIKDAIKDIVVEMGELAGKLDDIKDKQ